MLRCILVSSDPQLTRELRTALSAIPEVELAKAFTECPSSNDLLRAIRVRKVNLLLFGADDLLRVGSLAKSIDDLMPGLPIITAGHRDDPKVLRSMMHLGVREYISSPIDAGVLREALLNAEQRLASHPIPTLKQADLYTFLPAKPGSGTTTIAVSTSCALVEEFGARTLLLDSDTAAGTVQFLLKVGQTASFVDALTHTENLDEDLWSQMVGKWDGLDVLHAGRLDPPANLNPAHLEPLLSMARSQYEVICVDLPSSLDPLSVALLKESRRIMLVTTPEVVPLHMAAARMRRLTELGLEDRVSLVLNRRLKSGVTDAQVAELVGAPVGFHFSNDYRVVQDSVLNGSPVPHDSELGKSILDLAHCLAPQFEAKPAPHHRRFLEFFRIPHESESDLVMRG